MSDRQVGVDEDTSERPGIRPKISVLKTTVLKLEQADEALAKLSKDRDDSSLVLMS